MSSIGDEEPPDRGGTPLSPYIPMDLETQPNNTPIIVNNTPTITAKAGCKRPADNSMDPNDPVKKTTPPSASQQHTYVRPGYESGSDLKYLESDSGPYVVQVTRVNDDSHPSNRMRGLKMAQIIYNSRVTGIKEMKSVGKNKLNVYFATGQEANSFTDNPILAENKLAAAIPKFQVSRMGVIREVPLDWTLEELIDGIESSSESGTAIKARRLNKKKFIDGKPTWEPTETVVLTFLGQNLPEKIYVYHMSIPVDTYKLPTIQCHKCCRFGHTKDHCRSNPRCARCAQNHAASDCSVPDSNISCLYCSGPHAATDNRCPEFSRQRSIKLVMSIENIGYVEAARRFRPVRLSYADKIKSTQPPNSRQAPVYEQPPSPERTLSQTSLFAPSQPPQSYKKTVTIPRRPRPTLGKTYDVAAHRAITYTPQSSLPNGCALGHHDNSSPNDNLADLITKMLFNLLSKFSDIIPYTVLEALQGQISSAINKAIQDDQSQPDTVEC